jgi:hypothetical protein
MRPGSDGMHGKERAASSAETRGPLERQQFSARYPSSAFMASKSAL